MRPSEALLLHRKELTAAALRHHVRNLRVFGSVVRGEDTDRSDLDLLVDFGNAPTLFDLGDFQSELEKILDLPVEIVLEGDPCLKEHIGDKILSEAVPLTAFKKIDRTFSKEELESMRKDEKERRIPDYLKDMEDCAIEIEQFTSGMEWEDFEKDRKTQLVVERLLITIGEAAKKILDEHGEFARSHPEIPFKKAYDLRIKLTHGYTSINARSVWGTVQENLPELLKEIRTLLPDLLKQRESVRKKDRDSGLGF